MLTLPSQTSCNRAFCFRCRHPLGVCPEIEANKENEMKKTKQLIGVSVIVLASLSSAFGSYLAPYSDSTDTVALWHMDSIRGDKYMDDDDSFAGTRNANVILTPNPVSTSGGPSLVTPSVYPGGNSAFGSALHFDGDDGGAIPNSLLSIDSTKLRIEGWVKSDAAANGQMVMDRWNQINVYANSGGFSVLAWDQDSGTSTINANPGGFVATDWNHVAVEVNGATLDIYVNGGLVNSATLAGGGLNATTSKTTTYLAQRYTGGSRFTGAIDEFRISTIPEPATLGLVAVFGGGILFIRRRLAL